ERDANGSGLSPEGRLPNTKSARRPAAAGFDAATGTEALRTISAEILIDKLGETLMRTAIQHTGVERGVLIVRRAEEARVEAEATMRRGANRGRRPHPPPDPTSAAPTSRED